MAKSTLGLPQLPFLNFAPAITPIPVPTIRMSPSSSGISERRDKSYEREADRSGERSGEKNTERSLVNALNFEGAQSSGTFNTKEAAFNTKEGGFNTKEGGLSMKETAPATLGYAGRL